MARTPWPAAVLFDLDGTLIDSAPDLRAAVNQLLAGEALGPLTLPQVVGMIGDGVKMLVERAFAACGRPLEGEALERQYRAMLAIYGDHVTGLTTLTPGARQAVEQLHAAGVKLALVTNKPQHPTETILEFFGLSSFFQTVIGGEAGFERKPAPDMLLAALQRLAVKPADAVMVGDGAADVGSARAAGLRVVAVRGGYGDVATEKLGADAVIDTLSDLVTALPALAP